MKTFDVVLPAELNTYIDVETEGRDAIIQQAHQFLTTQLDGFVGITHEDPMITVVVTDNSTATEAQVTEALNTLRIALGV